MHVFHDRNLIINYIPTCITDASLNDLFSSVGTIKTCRIIRNRNDGSSFGFGFCEYEDSESALKAIERFNGYRIADKVLKVSLAKMQNRLCHTSNLYVKNFPTSLREENLTREFERYGRVVQCRILRDHGTDVSRGSAYVLFESGSDAESAKKALDGRHWPGFTDGPVLSIKYATPPYRQSNNARGARNGIYRKQDLISNPKSGIHLGEASGKVNNQSQAGVGANNLLAACLGQPVIPNGLYNPLVQTLQGQMMQSPLPIQNQVNSQTVLWPNERVVDSQSSHLNFTPAYISPYYFAQQTIPNLWSSHPTNLTQLPCNGFYAPLNIYGNSIQGCPIIAELPQPIQPLSALNGYAHPPVVESSNRLLAEVPSLSRSKTNKAEKSEMSSVYVYNIGNFMTESHLCALFSRFGTISNVSIPKDFKTKVTRNFGFVTFTNHHSAQLAIEAMNGFPLSGRRLQVSFRKSKSGVKANNSKTADTSPSKVASDVADSGCHSPQVPSHGDAINTTSVENELLTETTESFSMCHIHDADLQNTKPNQTACQGRV